MLGPPFSNRLAKGKNSLETLVCVCWQFWDGGFRSTLMGIFGGYMETQGTYHHAVPQVPTSLESTPSSLHPSDFLPLCVVL